jgi:hypothetical protein
MYPLWIESIVVGLLFLQVPTKGDAKGGEIDRDLARVKLGGFLVIDYQAAFLPRARVEGEQVTYFSPLSTTSNIPKRLLQVHMSSRTRRRPRNSIVRRQWKVGGIPRGLIPHQRTPQRLITKLVQKPLPPYSQDELLFVYWDPVTCVGPNGLLSRP